MGNWDTVSEKQVSKSREFHVIAEDTWCVGGHSSGLVRRETRWENVPIRWSDRQPLGVFCLIND